MKIHLPAELLERIERHAERCYPDEGAGVLFGVVEGDQVLIKDLLPMENSFDQNQRRRRYMIDGLGMLKAELEAEERELEVVGIFHSHPDHPPRPSAYDLEHSLPWYSYIITSVEAGVAGESKAWRLEDDRSKFNQMDWLMQSH